MLIINYEVIEPMNLFRFKASMNPEQAEIVGEFEKMIEAEFSLCLQEIVRANRASYSPDETELKSVDGANRDIDSILSYWSNRLGLLLEWMETKDYPLSRELNRRYFQAIKPSLGTRIGGESAC
jgi:hypothetical protein